MGDDVEVDELAETVLAAVKAALAEAGYPEAAPWHSAMRSHMDGEVIVLFLPPDDAPVTWLMARASALARDVVFPGFGVSTEHMMTPSRYADRVIEKRQRRGQRVA